MIQLTRLNNKPLIVNSDLIKFVEQSPDTLVTLITGEKIVVLEKAPEVLNRVIDFRRSVLQGLSLTWDPSTAHVSVTKSAETNLHEPAR
jgi:flagellar protein FlbD